MKILPAVGLLSVLICLCTVAPCLNAALLDRWRIAQVSTGSTEISFVVYGKGVFVAAGGTFDGGALLSSVDGQTWHVRANTTSHNPSRVWGLAFTGSRFVAVGHFGGTAISENGTNWVFGQAPAVGLIGPSSIFNRLIAVDGWDRKIWLSTNGVHWSTATNVPGPASYFTDSYAGVVIGDGYTYVPVNLHSWVPSATNSLFGPTVGWANDLYFIPSRVAGTNFLSRDRTNWTAVATGLTNVLGKPIYARGLYIAPAGDFTAVSQDGTNWNLLSSVTIRNGRAASFATDGKQLIRFGQQPNASWFNLNSFAYSTPLVDLAIFPTGSLTLYGVTGNTYRVEYRDAFGDEATLWTEFATLQVTNGLVVLTNASAGPHRFFRAMIE